MEFHITDYGAVGDGITLNTTSIQAAVDACTNSGEGRVTISSGIYKTGTIILKDGVELHIEANANLLVNHIKHANLLPRFRSACLIFCRGMYRDCHYGQGNHRLQRLKFCKRKRRE